MPLSPLLRRYDHALLDLDGCVWVGDEPTARAVEAVTALRRAGKGIALVTNDSRVSGEDLVRKLWGQGFQASLEEVVTVGGALQHLLAERADRVRNAFVIGSDAIAPHVEDAGLRVTNGTEFATRSDVVVVGLDERLDYAQLRTAVQALDRGAALVATGRGPPPPPPRRPVAGNGSPARRAGVRQRAARRDRRQARPPALQHRAGPARGREGARRRRSPRH